MVNYKVHWHINGAKTVDSDLDTAPIEILGDPDAEILEEASKLELLQGAPWDTRVCPRALLAKGLRHVQTNCQALSLAFSNHNPAVG